MDILNKVHVISDNTVMDLLNNVHIISNNTVIDSLNKVHVISNNTAHGTTLDYKVYDEYNTVQYNWSE